MTDKKTDTTNQSRLSLGSRIVLILSFVAATLLAFEVFIVIFSFLPGFNFIFFIYGIAFFSSINLFFNAPSFVLGLLSLYLSKRATSIIAPEKNTSYAVWSRRIGLYVTIVSFILFFYALSFISSQEAAFAHIGGL